MSLPGVSRHRRIMPVCWRTMPKASSSRRGWSSAAAMAAMVEAFSLSPLAGVEAEEGAVGERRLEDVSWSCRHEHEADVDDAGQLACGLDYAKYDYHTR